MAFVGNLDLRQRPVSSDFGHVHMYLACLCGSVEVLNTLEESIEVRNVHPARKAMEVVTNFFMRSPHLRNVRINREADDRVMVGFRSRVCRGRHRRFCSISGRRCCPNEIDKTVPRTKRWVPDQIGCTQSRRVLDIISHHMPSSHVQFTRLDNALNTRKFLQPRAFMVHFMLQPLPSQ